MNALPKQHAFANETRFERTVGPAMRLVAESREKAVKTLPKFPQRPNLQVLSQSIPLFYICQNRHGFWIARDAEGRNGGLFLRRQSALAFARRQSTPTGCAIMQLGESAELDIENQGNRVAVPLGRMIDLATQRAPRLAAFAGTLIAEWRELVAEISSVLASGRKHRAAAERELFHGQHWLSAKGDDDLPVC
jgi:hypothetical protein